MGGEADAKKIYAALGRAARALLDALPQGVGIDVAAEPPPDEDGAPPPVPDISRFPPEAAALFIKEVFPRLRALDSLAPLVRSRADGVWETLSLYISSHSTLTSVSVTNHLGTKEHVTTWGTEHTRAFTDWCDCRRASTNTGSAWDGPRNERRVASGRIAGEHASLIDPGCYRAIDLLAEAGVSSFTSCEGHPWGAYLGFRGLDHGNHDAIVATTTAFSELGWKIEPYGGEIVVRMPDTLDVGTRDDRWRAAIDLLTSRLAPATSPGPRR